MFVFVVQRALLLTEVLKERDAQIELKRLKESANLGQDDDSVRRWQKDYEESKKVCKTATGKLKR